ncbi:MAG: ABC transporter permease [Acidobacteriia bacterium]|nr:ABC transporter permease [Terriglobia bacterium]
MASFSHFAQDLRYGLRMLAKNPGFTAITVLTLALGIGANTAMFSVIDSVLLRPLPYRESDRLMVVWEKPPGELRNGVSGANFLDWRDQNHVFEHLAGLTFASFNISGKDLPERVDGWRTSWDFFDMLGVRPLLGRGFVADDDRPGAPAVTILSHELWVRRFGGDAQIIGRSLTVDGDKCTVIGVMPARFRFFGSPEMWMPLALDRAKVTRDFHFMIPMARLKPGISLARARAEMDSIGKNIEIAYPKSNKGWGVFVEPVRQALMQDQRTGVLVLFGAVGFVLLIACVNVANLLLAKAAVRQRELAVRASVGAGRVRLVAQLLTESVMLAVAGGLLGLLLAFWLVKIVRALVPSFLLSGLEEIAVDWRVLAFSLGLSIVTGLFFGVFPAWRVSKLNLSDILKEGGRGSGGAGGHARFRSVLVASEVALSLVLLVSAGLMIRSLLAMQTVNPGFRPDHLLTMRLSMGEHRYPGAAAVRTFYRQVLDKAASIPGVQNASISTGLPLQGVAFGMPFQIASHPQVPISEAPGEAYELVSADYFRTMGITLRKGRFFTERDNENGSPVSIVNESFVKKYLAKEEALGQRLLVQELITGKTELGPPIAWQIVGVIADVKFGGLNSSGVPVIYVPIMQNPWPGGSLALRTAMAPLSVAQAARVVLAQLDRDMPITSVKAMDQIVVESMSQSRTQTWLIGAFAVVALALAALGIYGVMSYSVAQDTHDIGIRLALGASTGDVLKLVLGRGTLLTGAGLLAGLAGSFALTRLLSSLLFNVKATDPWTFVAVSLLLTLVAVVAGFIPARRATRIDPVVALRFE